MDGENFICKEHSGFKARIKECEDNVSRLWQKWDRMLIMVIAILIGIITNLGILIFR